MTCKGSTRLNGGRRSIRFWCRARWYMVLVTISHFIPQQSWRVRRTSVEGSGKARAEIGRTRKRGGRGMNEEKSESRSGPLKPMRGRFGSPIFEQEGVPRTRSFNGPLPTPTQQPRIELSVQISILTANLPANSPPSAALRFAIALRF